MALPRTGLPRVDVVTGLPVDGLEETGPEVPFWARHTSGRSSLPTPPGGTLVHALARASGPEEVVQALLAQRGDFGALARSLPTPALRLVERIVEVGARAERNAERETRRYSRASRAAPGMAAANTVRPNRSASRSTSSGAGYSFISRAPVSQANSGNAGVGQVMKLAKKLQDLIHLAEHDRRRDDARRQVRMSDQEVAEGGAGGPTGAEGAQKINMKNLLRDVFNGVSKGFEDLAARRPEDSQNMWA
jgi:hypothetical protein